MLLVCAPISWQGVRRFRLSSHHPELIEVGDLAVDGADGRAGFGGAFGG
jgi:hypothetical protein